MYFQKCFFVVIGFDKVYNIHGGRCDRCERLHALRCRPKKKFIFSVFWSFCVWFSGLMDYWMCQARRFEALPELSPPVCPKNVVFCSVNSWERNSWRDGLDGPGKKKQKLSFFNRPSWAFTVMFLLFLRVYSVLFAWMHLFASTGA